MRRGMVMLSVVVFAMAGSAWSKEPVFDDRGRPLARNGMNWERDDQGALPVDGSKSSYTDPESGLILRWLTSYDALPGFFEDDLIGENSVVQTCDGQRLGTADDAPYVYWYEGSTFNFGTSRWNTPFDSATCSDINENLVRYFYTRVMADAAVDTLLSLGHDDSMRVWVNGAQVYEGVEGDWVGDEHQVGVHLNPGWNSLMVKMYFPELSEDLGYRYFSLRFLDEQTEEPVILTQSIDGWCSKEEEGRNWVYAGGVADLPGALGSLWASDLRVTNILPYKMLVTIEYFREGQARPAKADGPDASVDVVFEPYESRTWERVLPSLFGIDEPQKGMLAIRGFDDWDSERGAVSLTTYNRSGSGTFGMTIPFVDKNAGWTGFSQTLLGLRNGPGFRTNVAGFPTFVLNTETSITVTVWDLASGEMASREFTVRGYFQINDIFEAVGLGNLETNDAAASVSWSSSDTGSRWNFTASVNDNITSDPTFVGEGPWFKFPDN